VWAPSVTEQGVLVAVGEADAETWVTGVWAGAGVLLPWIYVPTQNAPTRSSSAPRAPPIRSARGRLTVERLEREANVCGVVARVGLAKKSRSFARRWEGGQGKGTEDS